MSPVSPDSRRLCAATPCSHEYLCMASRAFFTFWQSSDDVRAIVIPSVVRRKFDATRFANESKLFIFY
jgi:hypothetical protein